MKKSKCILSLMLIFSLFSTTTVFAHPGKTDKNGGHTCNTNCEKWGLKKGQYHYHLSSTKAPVFTTKPNINLSQYKKYVLSGTGQANTTLSVTLTDGKSKVTKTAKVNKNGKFSITADTKTLKDGKITVKAELIDDVKAKSTTTTFTVNKDTVAPKAPTYTASKTIDKKNVKLYTVSGTGEKGAKVTVSLKDAKATGQSKTIAVDAKGNYKVTLDMSKNKDGAYNLNIVQKDAYGNNSTQVTAKVTKKAN